MATIQEFTSARNITSLLHFTQVSNLDSILSQGLCTPNMCRAAGIAPAANDAIRYDGQDAICLSIEFPNYQLYWSFHNRDKEVKWVVIELNVRVLWEKRCCFCQTNAADNTMSTMSFASRQGLPALESMFGDYAGKPRASLGIPDFYPTNPQAEVLCIDLVEPQYIEAVYFNHIETYKQYQAAYSSGVKWGRFFGYRRDWSHWK